MFNYKTTILTLSALLLVSLPQLKAQINSTMHAHQTSMWMHQNNTNQMRIMSHMKFAASLKKWEEKYKFNIVTLEGDTILAEKKIKIEFSEPITKLVLKNKDAEHTFTPDQTKEIYTTTKGKSIVGFTHKDHWLFNTYSTDRFKLYSLYPENDISYVGYYQMANDSIRKLALKNVEMLVQGNEQALKAYKKRKTEKALLIYIEDEAKRKKKEGKIKD